MLGLQLHVTGSSAECEFLMLILASTETIGGDGDRHCQAITSTQKGYGEGKTKQEESFSCFSHWPTL